MYETIIIDIATRLFYWACGRIANLIIDTVLNAEVVEQKTENE